MEPYTDKVVEHFKNPRNVGEIEDADGIGHIGSEVCGDIMDLYIKVKNNVLVDVKYKTYGCGAAIASGSMLTELIKGKTIDDVLKVTNKRVVEALGGLPGPKVHCSVLAEDALKSALNDYYLKTTGKGLPGFKPRSEHSHDEK
ncbi:MAG: Fe-S cluster assembly scaffold protein NifU [Candidatus Margulisbacteria bacterium]|nr:Fe-S cluster assembly scaffold protein NifU [Candidatus Margulisiibacteriota bacterium]MBU1022319.1 Fe-S cluster assembly scaffold protein NifU [Candidatus Margulisiibacteriota bacterium]MBU1729932.1 Fe-S cluster assembly scaffold protein NifU [Candidatus Margulisiibacteriota bacterium]MBU1955965.1 Fe-S cluster assembly scaffold protein NifU [Candidatus Margulisiibacteriota bacterium]